MGTQPVGPVHDSVDDTREVHTAGFMQGQLLHACQLGSLARVKNSLCVVVMLLDIST